MECGYFFQSTLNWCFCWTVLFKPFTPKISLVILLTVCNTILLRLVRRILHWRNQLSPNCYFSLFSSLVCLILCRYFKEKILPWSVMVVKGLRSCLKHSPPRALQFLLGHCWLRDKNLMSSMTVELFFHRFMISVLKSMASTTQVNNFS